MTLSMLYGFVMFVVTLAGELLVAAAARGIVRLVRDWRIATWVEAI